MNEEEVLKKLVKADLENLISQTKLFQYKLFKRPYEEGECIIGFVGVYLGPMKCYRLEGPGFVTQENLKKLYEKGIGGVTELDLAENAAIVDIYLRWKGHVSHGFMYSLVKSDGKWKIIENMPTWISYSDTISTGGLMKKLGLKEDHVKKKIVDH